MQRQGSNGSADRMKVKVRFRDDTRVWRYDDHYDLNGLRKFIEQTWNLKEFTVQYDDVSDNDTDVNKLTIANKQDLSDMFVFVRNAHKNYVTIYVKEPEVDENANIPALQRQIVVLRQRVNALESRLNAEEKVFLESQAMNAASENKKPTTTTTKQKVHFQYPYPGIIQPFYFEMAMDRLITGYIHMEMLCVPKDQYFVYPSLASFSAMIMRYSGNVVQDEASTKEIEDLTISNKTLNAKLGIAEFRASQREVVLKPEDYGHWSDDDDRYLGRNDDDGYWS
mmetsp:Transcript_21787/g.34990  ORF Transcript_21787/g.34990 Transcript_21787/m.34990 type:complete len:281 (-) Transcript_21787:127-969(-)